MPHQTTSYTVATPSRLWQLYSQARDDTQNLNDALVEDIARRVNRELDDAKLDAEDREIIATVLPGEEPKP